MAVRVNDRVVATVQAAQGIKATAERFATTPVAGVTVRSLMATMSNLQTQFEVVMAMIAELRTVLTDAEIDERVGDFVLPAPVGAVNLLGTPAEPGPILIAGAACRMTWEAALPGLGAVDNGNGTLDVPALRWNRNTAKMEEIAAPEALVHDLRARFTDLALALVPFG